VNRLVLKDTSFAKLMEKRILNVLLIATKYDLFMLEVDGRIEEQIFNEYTSLSLSYPPRFTQVTSEKEAVDAMKRTQFDLIICMPNMDNSDIFTTANKIKMSNLTIPIVVLTPFSVSVTKRISHENLNAIDYVFSWLGNPELILAIIKLIEDKMNADDDIASVGVQTILLVEDSIRFYSSVLPQLYKFVLQQSKDFSEEALNGHQKTLRMRGRPKILLARSYEEACELYGKYGNNMLGIISDMSFNRGEKKDKFAGHKLGEMVRKIDRFIPIIFDSSETSNKEYADQLHCSFIDKNSKSFSLDLKKEIITHFGFGDFIILDPVSKKEINRIGSLSDLQKKVFNIPDDSLIYHLSRNHFSRFFYSRAIFPIADFLKHIDISEYSSMDEARQVIFDVVDRYRKMKNSGIIALFQKDRFDEYSNFARIGEGSMGGKARGLAFMGQMIKQYSGELEKFPNIVVKIPKTVILCTDIFDEFMESNNLYEIALKDIPDEEILRRFLQAHLPSRLREDVLTFLEVVKAPVAVRSSSLLEDSHYKPFAGIYNTYMVPDFFDKEKMLKEVGNAIKGVYASVFYKESKDYMAVGETQGLIDSEKMAIVLQEVVGQYYGDIYYPTISGVARSLNYYPIGNEKVDEGIVNVALGLGKYIVDDKGVSIRFSPLHPGNVVQTSVLESSLKEMQTTFCALSLQASNSDALSVKEDYNIVTFPIEEADRYFLQYLASTYDSQDKILTEGYYPDKKKHFITFWGILQDDIFPMASILDYLLKLSRSEMGHEVEIEFAVNLKKTQEGDMSAVFYLLQLRPVVDRKEIITEDLAQIDKADCLIQSKHALGHGIIDDLYDIVYVKTDLGDASNSYAIAREIETINKQMIHEKRNYILVGPGRWGSSDHSLGIPVKWSYISNAKLIVESRLNSRIDPSQGTHFFHNLTSLGVNYFTVNLFPGGDGLFDEITLNVQPAVQETAHLRHIRFEQPIVIKVDGKKSIGVVLKPQS
jgi:CheY-like chemotaxis protein